MTVSPLRALRSTVSPLRALRSTDRGSTLDPLPSSPRAPRHRFPRWAGLLVPVALAVADALLVNGVTLGLELNVSLVAAGALLLRRRFPALVFLTTLPGILIGYIWFAPMIALYTVAERRPDRRLLGISALLLAAAHFVPWPVSDFEPTAYRENTLTLIDACVTSVGPIALGLLVRTRGELAARIADLTRSRRHADELIAAQVLSTERARLAREMHDVVAHQVSLISLQAGAVQISAEDPKAREGARTIRELSVRTLDELRHMVGILRAAGGDHEELTPQPRLADLHRLIELSALDVAYEAGGAEARTGRPEAVERAAFRIVQEALTNVRKHAPGARVTVRVSDAQPDGTEEAEEARGLRVEVRNGPPDASAVAPGLPGGGHGLIGLRERAQLLGGTLEAGPTDEGGFVVRADFPRSPRVPEPRAEGVSGAPPQR
ncbi:histidine kinase [Streptomyces sp. NPDC005322]|uniref:sensor histidine kinase n=1 Tax=unclassified Streptomyces TaxID=2593676 RepID=UPI0033A5474F